MKLESVASDLNAHFATVRGGLTQGYTVHMTQEQEEALAWLETFAAIGLRIMQTTNPSKIRDAARAEEIKARIQGRPVLED